MYTVGHKDGIFFLRSNIEMHCFFFGSFVTLEQVNDYEMIPEYQGEIIICKILRYVTFVWELFLELLLFGAMGGQLCHILSFFQLLAYVQ